MPKKPAAKPVKVSLNIEEKQAVIAKAEHEAMWSHSKLAEWATAQFGLRAPMNRTTVCKILQRAKEIKSVDAIYLKRTNVTKPLFPALEEELVQWIIQVQRQGVSVTGSLIQAEAANIASRMDISTDKFKCSNGWLERFQQRYRARIKKAIDEYDSAEGAARVEKKAANKAANVAAAIAATAGARAAREAAAASSSPAVTAAEATSSTDTQESETDRGSKSPQRERQDSTSPKLAKSRAKREVPASPSAVVYA